METVSCALCGGDDTALALAAADRLAAGREAQPPGPPPDLWTLVRCRACGLVYLSPRPGPADIGAFYPDDYHTARGTPGPARRLEEAWRRRQFSEVAAWLAGVRPWRGRLLDVGCGSGELLAALRADGWRVSGVEPSARSAAIARSQHALDVTTAQFEEAVLPGREFDVVVLAAVLEHLHEPVAALVHARRLLAPGGLVAVLFLPRFNAPQARLFRTRWIGLDLPRHLYHFEPATFVAIARKAGLRVVAREPYSRRHSPAFWAASLCPGLQKQRLNLLARHRPGRAAAGRAAFAPRAAAARPLARAEASLGLEPQDSYFLIPAGADETPTPPLTASAQP
jgi:SAM-dependent methyltransferase